MYSISEISRLSGFSRDTLRRWKRDYLIYEITGLTEKSRAPKTHPRKTSSKIEQSIIQLRKRYRYCALKIQLKLRKEGIHIHPRTVHKILKRNGLIRKRKRYNGKDIDKKSVRS